MNKSNKSERKAIASKSQESKSWDFLYEIFEKIERWRTENRSPDVAVEAEDSCLNGQMFLLPLTVREAVEVWFPTVKVTVPESVVVTPLSVRL